MPKAARFLERSGEDVSRIDAAFRELEVSRGNRCIFPGCKDIGNGSNIVARLALPGRDGHHHMNRPRMAKTDPRKESLSGDLCEVHAWAVGRQLRRIFSRAAFKAEP